MKYGKTNTFKNHRRVGRHGHRPGAAHSGKTYASGARPSRTKYFTLLKWIENKRKRIAKDKKRQRCAA
jgi:hypothetical protein